MAGVKIMVMYPPPRDMAAFEKAYSEEHIPMAGPIFQAAGATKVVLAKVAGSPSGAAPFHRVAEVHFSDMATLQACAASKPGQDAVAHANQISNGGPPVVMIADEDVITF